LDQERAELLKQLKSMLAWTRMMLTISI
jgi:hypothetical protein